jgi:hypothetical protein
MIKTQIQTNRLMEWFTKSLLPTISRDVAISKGATEEQAIICAQHSKLIYSHTSTLYDTILHAPRSSIDPNKIILGPHFYCEFGSISHASMN